MLSLTGAVWGNHSLLESGLKCLDTKGRNMSFKKCFFLSRQHFKNAEYLWHILPMEKRLHYWEFNFH